MPVPLRTQRQAIDTARRILLGSPMPRRSEREELAAQLDEAAETILRAEKRRAADPWGAESTRARG